MEAGTNRRQAVTAEELREAERGLVRLLHKKRFPREWIERNVPDVMAQARTDFAARLAAGKKDETVNLLVVIGYRRAVKVLDAQLAAPSTTSIETVFHLADESTSTPEEEAIEHDREERVARAMAYLPDRERKLMALVYFDGKSVRDAGRRLGWGKSSADRHHRAALEKLHELLDRSLLSPEIHIPPTPQPGTGRVRPCELPSAGCKVPARRSGRG
jgi:RNA polymerase sigma factor (sigma-70 family)